MIIKIFLVALFVQFAAAPPVFGSEPKKTIDHTDYADWKNLGSEQFSKDGEWVSYEINPQHRGDGWLYLKEVGSNEIDSVARGTDASFSPNSNFLVFKVEPQADVVRQARVEEEAIPEDSLFIWTFSDMAIEKIEGVKSFSTPSRDSDWIVYHMEEQENENEDGPESDGTGLVVYNPVTGSRHTFENVESYTFSDNGKLVAMVKTVKESDVKTPVRVFNTSDESSSAIFEDKGEAAQLTVDDEGDQTAFVFTFDDEDPRIFDLYHWEAGNEQAERVVEKTSAGMPEDWSVSRHGSLSFSGEASRLYFGTAPKPEPEPEDTLLSDEKYRVDIWHYEDPHIQPQQLVEKEREMRRTYRAVYHLGEERMVQLAREDMPDLSTIQDGDGDIALGSSHLPYRKKTTWSASNYRDYYLVDVNTGEREQILERDLFHTSLSPDGNYLLNYEYTDSSWYAISVEDGTKKNLTGDIPHEFYNVLNDRPQEPSPYGIAGWVEDERYVLIYDHHDIWRVDPAGDDQPVNVTGGYGRENNIRLRYVDLEGNDYIGRRQTLMLDAFNDDNKQSGFYEVAVHRPGSPSQIVMDDVRYLRPTKAEDADILMWRKSTFRMYPDLWLSDMSFDNARKISNTNPQQDEYRWGDVELVEGVSFNNDTLQGLLYTPDDLDPNKEHPMIVYFYERKSHEKHHHFIPMPSRARIYTTPQVSNGYVVFVPDINPYIEGYPGETAYNSIVSGTKAMLNKYDFIDRERIALCGQSWGGYQAAYIVTRTDMFTAAVAGTPVSNMFSAYGGIRWATGRSRQFQYEETQSRIGGTMWDYPLRYLENSPLFFADKIDTPMMIMHNDADGAVPWYQGIELYMALRRLGSPAWLLSYDDEAHNLQRWPNRIDYDIRMNQFFDHYLKDKPAPVWMEEGIPAIKKGRIDGYEPAE